jgi:hypothetical protein
MGLFYGFTCNALYISDVTHDILYMDLCSRDHVFKTRFFLSLTNNAQTGTSDSSFSNFYSVQHRPFPEI